MLKILGYNAIVIFCIVFVAISIIRITDYVVIVNSSEHTLYGIFNAIFWIPDFVSYLIKVTKQSF